MFCYKYDLLWGDVMIANWEELKKECLACQKCNLCKTRTNVVFGEGTPKAKVLFIGEAPGENEDKQGLPFVGRSGKLLDTFLNDVGLSREKDIFIANIVKCRPPENRDPLPKEREACFSWLQAQINFIQPKIIVCLGRVAAQVIISPKFAIMKEHGKWILKDGIWYTAILHPAAILRNPNNKPSAVNDFINLKQKMQEV